MSGTIGFQTIVLVGAVVALARLSRTKANAVVGAGSGSPAPSTLDEIHRQPAERSLLVL